MFLERREYTLLSAVDALLDFCYFTMIKRSRFSAFATRLHALMQKTKEKCTAFRSALGQHFLTRYFAWAHAFRTKGIDIAFCSGLRFAPLG